MAATVFVYTAVDATGKQKKGNIEAATEDAARAALKNQGLTPITIGTAGALSKDINISIGGSVKPRDLAIFCKQFQSILHAGVTVIQALKMLSEQCENKKLKLAVTEVAVMVEKGDTLAGALSVYQDVFPPIMINMIEAGEASGSLEGTLERLAITFDKNAQLKSMMVSAMIYPAVLVCVIIGVVILMLAKVVPSFQETFDAAGGSLPGITLAVVALSNGLIHNWPIILLVVVGVIVGIKIFMGTDTGAVFFGTIAMKAPIFGDLTVKSACAQLARTLSSLMASGINMVDAIEIVSKIMSNRLIKVAIQDAKKEVEQGVPLSRPLEDSGIFPSLLCHMTKIGEETGNMEEMLSKVAEYYDEEVEQATQNVTAVMEPLIILVLAAVVVPIMLAIMAPMLSIYSMAENS